MKRRSVRTAFAALRAQVLVFVVVGSSGCSTLGYYGQAAVGGASIAFGADRIDALLARPDLDEELRARLELTQQIRDFAIESLDLPDSGSYRKYRDVEGPFALWNVVAAPELGIDPLTWCFPIAGCVSYRGYFDRQDAERFARKLEKDGYDVSIGGVTAYSTLGWLKDPVLSTFLRYPDADLAGLLFHELAHERVYVQDDTAFNESLATTIEIEGVRRWLDAQGRADELSAFIERNRHEQEISELLNRFRERLQEVYAQSGEDAWKLARKQEVFAELKGSYHELQAAWAGDDRYEEWFGQPLNNAHLAAVGAYHELVPAFDRLLAAEGGDLTAFFDRALELAELDFDARRAELSAIGSQG